MANPILKDRYFEPRAGGAPMPPPAAPGQTAYAETRRVTMTFGGVTSAAGLMLLFMIAAGIFGWSKVHASDSTRLIAADFPTAWVLGSVVVGFVLVIACTFRPLLARFLAIPYALAEGVFLGAVSHVYDIRTNGVALQAVLATIVVFGVMLLLYGLRILRVTPRMTKIVIAATAAVALTYLIGFIASFFTDGFVRFLDSPTPLSIGISLLVIGLACFNLLIDFDFIERGVRGGAPKEMEWFAALGLMVTIVWLYLELLRLLSKLSRR